MADFICPSTITKRDGTIVDFDRNRIKIAIGKALKSCEEDISNADIVTDDVIAFLNENYEEISVEICQDIVEKCLMKRGFYDVSKAYILYRQEHAKLRDQAIPEEWKKQAKEAISYFDSVYNYIVYLRTYAKWIPSKNRRETWPETVDRYMDFMQEIVQDKLREEEYTELREAILRMEVMPSMRLLQFSGKAVRRNHICAYNCSFIAPTKLKDFHDVMLILMCGCGVGFSVENKFIDQLPVIKEQTGAKYPTHIVEDSREGWCEAFYTGLDFWYNGYDVDFDYSKIRPSGARLITSGGRASGPAPLKDLMEFTRALILDNQGNKLNTIDVHDLVCKIGKIVVVGGVRRASEISLSDLHDESMRNAKTGTFWNTHPDRCMANNSTVYNKKPSDIELLAEWTSLAQSGSGERGIFNRGNLVNQIPERRMKFVGDLVKDMGCNPCVAGYTKILTIEGEITAENLVGRNIDLVVRGETRKMLSNGFYHTGKKDVYRVYISNGEYIDVTADHPFVVPVSNHIEIKVKLSDLQEGDLIIRNDGKWYKIHLIKLHKSNVDVYDVTVENHVFSANGFLVGNCGEILLLPREFCNLTSVVIRSNDNRDTLLRKIRLATILGTYQSMLTDFKNIDPTWKKLAETERLLGVSLNGMRDCVYIQKNLDILDELKEEAIKANVIYAERFGINLSTSVTTVKPEGTSAQMLGTSSGIHARFAPYYIRRIRISATDPLAKLLIDQGVPYHPENNQTWENANTWVFEFPQKSPEGAICADELSALDQLEFWKEVKLRYTEHNPSCTIYIKKGEWISVLNWIRDNWEIIGGLSFLPYDDHIYELPPYEKISKEKYEQLMEEMPEVDFAKMIMFEKGDNTTRKTTWACTGDKCERID